MGTEVSVDTRRLRAGAAALSKAGTDIRAARFDAGDLGSPRTDAAFESFERYWTSGRSALARSEDALVRVLNSAAEGYGHRDAENAREFSGGLRAF